jgi:hypothetical protein
MYAPARLSVSARPDAASRAAHAPALAPTHFPLPTSSAHAQPAQKSLKSVGEDVAARLSMTSSERTRVVARVDCVVSASRAKLFATESAVDFSEDDAASRLARDRAFRRAATVMRDGRPIDQNSPCVATEPRRRRSRVRRESAQTTRHDALARSTRRTSSSRRLEGAIRAHARRPVERAATMMRPPSASTSPRRARLATNGERSIFLVS